jgi:hypothetical protein
MTSLSRFFFAKGTKKGFKSKDGVLRWSDQLKI